MTGPKIEQSSEFGWQEMPSHHVPPVDDLAAHAEDMKCWCVPESSEDGLIVHNAMDQRELYEYGQRRLN